MTNKQSILLLIIITLLFSCGDFRRVKCPPNGTIAFIPKNCVKGYEIFTKTYDANLSFKLDSLKSLAQGNVHIKQTVTQLAQQLDQSNARFRASFVGICQTQAGNPCNDEIQREVLKTRSNITILYDSTASRITRLNQVLKQVNQTSQALDGDIENQIVAEINSILTFAQSITPNQ